MPSHAQESTPPDHTSQTIFRVMVIAAVSVIVVSLVGIGVVTGVIPRWSAELHSTRVHSIDQGRGERSGIDRQAKDTSDRGNARPNLATDKSR